MNAVVDASALLAAYLPQEAYKAEAIALVTAHRDGRLRLSAPYLLRYEAANVVLMAARRGRISDEWADTILDDVLRLHVARFTAECRTALRLAREFGCTAYDASYLALAQELGLHLITADKRLYNAVAARLPWVIWIGDWQERISLDHPESGGPEIAEAEEDYRVL